MRKGLDWAWKEKNDPSAEQRKAEKLKLKRKKRIAKRKNKKWRIRVRKKGNWRDRVCAMPGDRFFKTNVWRALRREVLEAYGYKCMQCDSIEDVQVDHIKPRSLFPKLSLTFSNLQVLCKTCNRLKSNKHETDFRERRVTEILDEQACLQLSKFI